MMSRVRVLVLLGALAMPGLASAQLGAVADPQQLQQLVLLTQARASQSQLASQQQVLESCQKLATKPDECTGLRTALTTADQSIRATCRHYREAGGQERCP